MHEHNGNHNLMNTNPEPSGSVAPSTSYSQEQVIELMIWAWCQGKNVEEVDPITKQTARTHIKRKLEQ